jgi:hypothetical protein
VLGAAPRRWDYGSLGRPGVQQGGQHRLRQQLAQAGEASESAMNSGCISRRPGPITDRFRNRRVFLLLLPRVVSFAVAVYQIFAGLVGLNGIYHIMT